MKTNLIMWTCLFTVSLCSSLHEKRSSEMCMRPKSFANSHLLSEYIGCLKQLTGEPRYGKRSNPAFTKKIRAESIDAPMLRTSRFPESWNFLNRLRFIKDNDVLP